MKLSQENLQVDNFIGKYKGLLDLGRGDRVACLPASDKYLKCHIFWRPYFYLLILVINLFL